jgi:hypothetical protein
MTVVLLISVTGCTSNGTEAPRVPGCAVPPNEEALLDAYADDPVLAVVPEGADSAGEASRSRACVRLNREDVSDTSVSRQWWLSRDLDEPTVRRLYEPVARAGGWQTDPRGKPSPPPPVSGDIRLTYCRTVVGVPSRLVIHAQPAQRVDLRPSTADRPPSPSWGVINPGGLYLSISAVPDGVATC